MTILEELNKKFLDVLLVVILMGGFMTVLLMNPNNNPNSCKENGEATGVGNNINGQFKTDFLPYANYIKSINQALSFNINDLDGRIDTSTLATEEGYRNGDLGPVVNFHQKFRLNNINHTKNTIIASDLNDRSTLYIKKVLPMEKNDTLDNGKESAIKELGWRNWWLRKKSKYNVNEKDTSTFQDIPTRAYLNKQENTQNIYLENK